MSSSRQILPPTDLEMKLFVKGKLALARQIEIKSLVESSPLFQDALDGYISFYQRNIFKKWCVGLVLFVAALGLICFSCLSSVEARYAEKIGRFNSLHVLHFKEKSTNMSPAIVVSTSSTEWEASTELLMENNRMIDRFQFPDDSLLEMKQNGIKVEKLEKQYLELGNDIRFVRGYMLLDKDYFKKVNTDVPVLGGLPAQYENKSRHVDSDTSHFILVSKTRDIDQMIGYYADSLFDESVVKGEDLLKDFPRDVNIEFYLAMSYFRKEDYTKALQHFLYAVNTTELLFDEDQDYYVAECYERLGRRQQAIEAFDLIIHSDSYYKKRAEARYRMIAR